MSAFAPIVQVSNYVNNNSIINPYKCQMVQRPRSFGVPPGVSTFGDRALRKPAIWLRCYHIHPIENSGMKNTASVLPTARLYELVPKK